MKIHKLLFHQILSSKKASDFLQKKDGNVLEAATKAKKPRRTISTIVAGKAITEDEVHVFETIQEYKSVSKIFQKAAQDQV